jgi:hypothetical protein
VEWPAQVLGIYTTSWHLARITAALELKEISPTTTLLDAAPATNEKLYNMKSLCNHSLSYYASFEHLPDMTLGGSIYMPITWTIM